MKTTDDDFICRAFFQKDSISLQITVSDSSRQIFLQLSDLIELRLSEELIYVAKKDNACGFFLC